MAAWRDGNAFECGPQGPPLSTSSHQHRAAAVRVDVSTAHLVRLPIAVGFAWRHTGGRQSEIAWTCSAEPLQYPDAPPGADGNMLLGWADARRSVC